MANRSGVESVFLKPSEIGNGMSITATEAEQLIESAVKRALAQHPVPSTVTIQQAAEMLKVSARTVARRNPPRGIGGKIPYEWVLAQRSK